MRSKQSQREEPCLKLKDPQRINLEQDELKKLDFNKNEYNYFIEYCNFSDRQKQILDLRRKGKSIVAISLELYLSERTVNREIKRIKHKIYKVI